jgi:hypothetical protein
MRRKRTICCEEEKTLGSIYFFNFLFYFFRELRWLDLFTWHYVALHISHTHAILLCVAQLPPFTKQKRFSSVFDATT